MDQQLDLYRFWRSEAGRNAAEAFAESVSAENGRAYAETFLDPLAQIEASKMYLGDPIYVDPEMTDLIRFAAESFQPEPLHEHDLVTQTGFAVLPQPFQMIDRHGKRVSFRAFAWMPVQFAARETGKAIEQVGIHLSLYSHIDDVVDGSLDDWMNDERNKEWDEQSLRSFAAKLGTPYTLAHMTPWTFEKDVPASFRDVAEQWWRPVQAFFRLTMQTVGERYQQQPPRASRKRWQRSASKPQEDRYITVIRLRRPRGHGDGEAASTIEWQQRWIVNGHWRNQWYPSLNTHRQVWISPYVKGPEDKPLLVRKGRAFELVR